MQSETKIRDIMVNKLETIGSSSNAQDAAKKMRDKQISSVLVIDDKAGKPLGIVTERDLVRKVCVSDKSSRELEVSQVMSSPLITINANLSPSYAADLMLRHKVRHLLVVTPKSDYDKDIGESSESDLELIGIITPMDFTRFDVSSVASDQTIDNYEDSALEGILKHYRDDFNFA